MVNVQVNVPLIRRFTNPQPPNPPTRPLCPPYAPPGKGGLSKNDLLMGRHVRNHPLPSPFFADKFVVFAAFPQTKRSWVRDNVRLYHYYCTSCVCCYRACTANRKVSCYVRAPAREPPRTTVETLWIPKTSIFLRRQVLGMAQKRILTPPGGFGHASTRPRERDASDSPCSSPRLFLVLFRITSCLFRAPTLSPPYVLRTLAPAHTTALLLHKGTIGFFSSFFSFLPSSALPQPRFAPQVLSSFSTGTLKFLHGRNPFSIA